MRGRVSTRWRSASTAARRRCASSIKDALRRDLAIEQLSHGDLPVPEIARAVGFAEPSAFHRAFKQWTGVRPGEYRRRLLPA
jgi:AraC-like DNA-binding protein